MAGSVNKVILVGNLGKDPEIKNFENGGSIAKFPLATSDSYKDQKTGEKVVQTEWHNLVIKRPALVPIAEQFLKKGMSVYVEGKLHTRTYQTKENETRYFTEVVVEEFQMLTPKSQDSAGATTEKEQEPVMHSAPEDDLPF
jgi:single-strand DNA-binding protein